MAIYEKKGVGSIIKEGNFVCPICIRKNSFKHIKTTDFHTFFSFPLIPSGTPEELVECQTCKGHFMPIVLNLKPLEEVNSTPPPEGIPTFGGIIDRGIELAKLMAQAMKNSGILLMSINGKINDKKIPIVLEIINKYTLDDITLGEFYASIIKVQQQPEPISFYLAGIASSFNEAGREQLIKCAVEVASIDGKMGILESQLIKEMAGVVEVSPSQFEKIVEEMGKG